MHDQLLGQVKGTPMEGMMNQLLHQAQGGEVKADFLSNLQTMLAMAQSTTGQAEAPVPEEPLTMSHLEPAPTEVPTMP